MKKLIIPFLLSLIFIITSFAQTVDEILAEHFNAVGQEKLLATKTIMMKGKIIQQSFEIPFTSYQKRPMNFRSEAEFQGMKILSGFDGTMGWSINPMMGSSDPQPMTEEQIDRMKIQADYDGLFYNYKEKGYTVEFLGKETVDDLETYVLKLTRPNGDVVTSYIDAENYVLLKSKSKMMMQGVETETEVIFSNYKYVNEILNPFSMETKMNGQTAMQMTFEEISYDTDMPDSMFEMPEISAPADTTGSK
ncbi:MAG: outer membrane lipoprotein-sorting protein [Ignavibacteriaceae bacterium]|jgi:outer membrane lipoprotein-sorting protein|nr:outer membrane lipoprotein-sorting protein [Ignavibacteriaceae bacterium]